MAKGIKLGRSAASGRFLTKPIGKAKAERFAAVEGMQKSPASKALQKQLADRGLKGDAYRTEVIRVFKKA